jgi:putative ABC transport system permease protein
MLKSFAQLRSTDLGCDTQNVLTIRLSLPRTRYDNAAALSLFNTLLLQARNYPGVSSAGLVSPTVPGNGYGDDIGFTILGESSSFGHGQTANQRLADRRYFEAMGIPIRSGRTFQEHQEREKTKEVMVSESFRQYFSGHDPIGQSIVVGGAMTYTVVGIVGDTRPLVGEPPQPTMYFPLDSPSIAARGRFVNTATLVVRSSLDVKGLAVPMRAILQGLDRNLPVTDIMTMDQVIGRQTMDASFNAGLLLVLSLVSLVIAAVGVFGVLSYILAQRTMETAIRIALGAQREQIIGLFVTDGLSPAIGGLVIGMAVSASVTPFIKSMLYETKPLDPTIFLSATSIVLLAAVAACVLPACRATRVEPMKAIRSG